MRSMILLSHVVPFLREFFNRIGQVVQITFKLPYSMNLLAFVGLANYA